MRRVKSKNKAKPRHVQLCRRATRMKTVNAPTPRGLEEVPKKGPGVSESGSFLAYLWLRHAGRCYLLGLI